MDSTFLEWEQLISRISPNYFWDCNSQISRYFRLHESDYGRLYKIEEFSPWEKDLHLSDMAYMIHEMIKKIVSPGIILRAKDYDIFCILCDQEACTSGLFDKEYLQHINSEFHLSKVEQNEKMRKLLYLDLYFEGSRTEASFHYNLLIQAVNFVCIIVTDDGKNLCCLACNEPEYRISIDNLSDLDDHLKKVGHRKWATKQLDLITRKAGLKTGITIRDVTFYCELCKHRVGNNLITTEAYYHHSSPQHMERLENRSMDFGNAFSQWMAGMADLGHVRKNVISTA